MRPVWGRLIMMGAVARLLGSDHRAIAWGAAPPQPSLRAAAFGLRLSASVVLAFYLAFWLQLDEPGWAGTTAAIVCQPQLGASLRKGWFRMLATVLGAVVAVLLTAAFPQDRFAFLALLALWGGLCAGAATLLRNFAAYAAGMSALTAMVITSDQLGATGGPNGEAFTIALMRVSAVCLGIISAGVVLAATDFGSARRGLATVHSGLIDAIARGLLGILSNPVPDEPPMRRLRRDLLGQVIALDTVADQAIGESAELRNRALTLQAGIAGCFAALSAWRAVALTLTHHRDPATIASARAILDALPPDLRTATDAGDATAWMRRPHALDAAAREAADRLDALSADTPAKRLLLDQTSRALRGLADALNSLALLVHGHARSPAGGGDWRLQVADWRPALTNGLRAMATIAAAQLIWILTTWPSGPVVMVWAAVIAILFSPRADQAYSGAVGYLVGNGIAVVGATVVGFAILPQLSSFGAFGLALALYLIPAGALMATGWQPTVTMGMVGSFVPILSPTNSMGYDMASFGDNAAALFIGAGLAMIGFRLWPPATAEAQAARLLRLALRDLRRLASGTGRWSATSWTSLLYSRLAALPAQATLEQRGELVATLGLGMEILGLRALVTRPDHFAQMRHALSAIADGRSRDAVAQMDQLDGMIQADLGAGIPARARILAITEGLTDHAIHFDGTALA